MLSKTATRRCSAPSTDPFRVLGLPRSASRDSVKKQYRELAKRYHPDSGGTPDDAARMERVNQAYNLLIKDNMYDKLHLPLPTAGPRRQPFGPAVDKLATLDPTTERTTPEGRFMYQCRASGDWVTLEEPLVRSEQPRYASFEQYRRQTDLYSDIRKKQEEVTQQAVRKTYFRRQCEKVEDLLPFNSPVVVVLALSLYVAAIYYSYERVLGKRDIFQERFEYYGDIRNHRHRLATVFPMVKEEADACAAASVLALIAAAEYADAERVPAKAVTDLTAKPPFFFYLLYNVT